MRLLLFLNFVTALALGAACCSTTGEPASTAGAGASGPLYSIEVRAPEKVTVGQEATAEILVTPRGGFKINVEYPAKLTLEAVPAGTRVPSETVTKSAMSVEDARLTVPVRFTADAPGERRLGGELRFSICNPQTCQMPRETVSFTTLAEGDAAALPERDAGSEGGAAEATER